MTMPGSIPGLAEPSGRLSRRSFALFSGAAALELMAGCGPRRPTGERLRVGYQRNGILLLAKARGQVAKTLPIGSLEWAEFPSGPPMLEALASGAIDVGATGDTPPIFAQSAGAPLRYVAVQPLTGQGEGILVPAASPIAKVADLRGKRIGFTKGSSSHLLVIKALRTAGLQPSDVRPSYLAPAEAAAALQSGALDAWATWDPYLALAQDRQKARLLISGADLPRSQGFLLASQHLIDTAPETLERFLDALRREAAWGEAHRAELVRIVSAGTGLPAAIVDRSLRRGPLAVEPITPEAVARQQASADIFAEFGIIPRPVSIKSAVWTNWRPNP